MAIISSAFSQFLTVTYGADIEATIARRDLGPLGSFGGGPKPMPNRGGMGRTRKRPIIIVHGLSTFAAEYENIRQYFLLNNYTDSELYASSYGHGPVNWTHDAMICEHVQRFRWLLLAVANYTDSQVDVIGYSMGSPIARKAILGGICVDTGAQLGTPLTALVHTFLGVAGANRDCVHLCRALTRATGNAPCNSISGMTCHSQFLQDINNAPKGQHFEASQRVYTISSRHDEVVGYYDCDGLLVSSIPSEDKHIELVGFSHLGTILGTPKEQMELINGNYEQQKINVTINWLIIPEDPFKMARKMFPF
uniref:Lipase domain-containing protein n=1 Tax=Globodera pallida TaxID=36090 RepID=A0A183BTN7_GLOPA